MNPNNTKIELITETQEFVRDFVLDAHMVDTYKGMFLVRVQGLRDSYYLFNNAPKGVSSLMTSWTKAAKLWAKVTN